jgi:hypothetical protein
VARGFSWPTLRFAEFWCANEGGVPIAGEPAGFCIAIAPNWIAGLLWGPPGAPPFAVKPVTPAGVTVMEGLRV